MASLDAHYLSAKLLVEGLRRAGRDITPDGLTQAMASMREVDLGGFVVRYGANNRVGSTYVEATIVSAEGKFVR